MSEEENKEEVLESTEEVVAEEAPKRVRRTNKDKLARNPRKDKKDSPANPPVITRPKKYTFEKWAARKGIPVHHRPGLRAYVKTINKLRTLEDWDECFKAY